MKEKSLFLKSEITVCVFSSLAGLKTSMFRYLNADTNAVWPFDEKVKRLRWIQKVHRHLPYFDHERVFSQPRTNDGLRESYSSPLIRPALPQS